VDDRAGRIERCELAADRAERRVSLTSRGCDREDRRKGRHGEEHSDQEWKHLNSPNLCSEWPEHVENAHQV